jgi:hypothetical protein
MANSYIFQFNGVHQVMESYVRISTAEPRQKRSHQPAERD